MIILAVLFLLLSTSAKGIHPSVPDFTLISMLSLVPRFCAHMCKLCWRLMCATTRSPAESDAWGWDGLAEELADDLWQVCQ